MIQVGGLAEARLSRRNNDGPLTFGRESRTENASTARSECLDCRRRLVRCGRPIVLRLRRLLLIGTVAEMRPSDGVFSEALFGHLGVSRQEGAETDKALNAS